MVTKREDIWKRMEKAQKEIDSPFLTGWGNSEDPPRKECEGIDRVRSAIDAAAGTEKGLVSWTARIRGGTTMGYAVWALIPMDKTKYTKGSRGANRGDKAETLLPKKKKKQKPI